MPTLLARDIGMVMPHEVHLSLRVYTARHRDRCYVCCLGFICFTPSSNEGGERVCRLKGVLVLTGTWITPIVRGAIPSRAIS